MVLQKRRSIEAYYKQLLNLVKTSFEKVNHGSDFPNAVLVIFGFAVLLFYQKS